MSLLNLSSSCSRTTDVGDTTSPSFLRITSNLNPSGSFACRERERGEGQREGEREGGGSEGGREGGEGQREGERGRGGSEGGREGGRGEIERERGWKG